ncbi:MAG: hypothetical protein PF692_15860 [Kiritimatiellae bacterium]|jgi:hypothetical protein|nr:hypothetical protein [Kiritimatiellia bacterium]
MKTKTIIKTALKEYGIKFPFVMLCRLIQYTIALTFLKPAKFKFKGKEYSYFVHIYNATFKSERIVEIPIALDFLTNTSPDKTLEIGNVLSHYTEVKHTIVDKYEKGEKVLNEDIISFKGSFDRIISISTFEHVGFDEDGEEASKVKPAFEHISELLNPEGIALITVPLGYNSYLDHLLYTYNEIFREIIFMKRTNKFNAWKEAEISEIKDCKYGVGSPCANAVAFCFIYK